MQYNLNLCVHGHFYQPPRDDPLTGEIPIEPGAKPYPNWNERIYSECYRPNAELSNFKRISFNIGPTLCEWLEFTHPDILSNIISQDQYNVDMHGVGNAIAQPYNHTILPLANYQDKVTQVTWGIADFTHRFGRKPQGMWLPETAVNTETLSILAQNKIIFTILAPWQTTEEHLDPTKPYTIDLPGGKSIIAFFFHQELSTALSFNPDVSMNADYFATQQLLPKYQVKDIDTDPQLILLATDGELYGHHQPMRDLFLAHLVNGASEQAGITITYPSLWLKDHQPRKTVFIKENSSWSCHHNLQRWMGACDCTPRNGIWKVYFRRALDNLAKSIDIHYFEYVVQYVPDPWLLLQAYIEVVLGLQTVKDLLSISTKEKLSENDIHKISLLLKAQYEKQRMFTSCGWFFEDFDRIEPQNNLAYAVNAVIYVNEAIGVDLSSIVLRDLHKVISQRSGLRGDDVFLKNYQRARDIGLLSQSIR